MYTYTHAHTQICVLLTPISFCGASYKVQEFLLELTKIIETSNIISPFSEFLVVGCCQYFLRKRLSDFETYSQGAARKFQGFGSGDTFAQHLMEMYMVPQKKFSDFSSIFPAQRPSHHHQQPIQAPIFAVCSRDVIENVQFFFTFSYFCAFLSQNVFYLGNKENCQIVTIIIGASSNTTRLSNLTALAMKRLPIPPLIFRSG